MERKNTRIHFSSYLFCFIRMYELILGSESEVPERLGGGGPRNQKGYEGIRGTIVDSLFRVDYCSYVNSFTTLQLRSCVSCKRWQHGGGCYFKRMQPPQRKLNVCLLLRNILTFFRASELLICLIQKVITSVGTVDNGHLII